MKEEELCRVSEAFRKHRKSRAREIQALETRLRSYIRRGSR